MEYASIRVQFLIEIKITAQEASEAYWYFFFFDTAGALLQQGLHSYR